MSHTHTPGSYWNAFDGFSLLICDDLNVGGLVFCCSLALSLVLRHICCMAQEKILRLQSLQENMRKTHMRKTTCRDFKHVSGRPWRLHSWTGRLSARSQSQQGQHCHGQGELGSVMINETYDILWLIRDNSRQRTRAGNSTHKGRLRDRF